MNVPLAAASRAWWVDLQWFHKLGKGPGQIAGRASYFCWVSHGAAKGVDRPEAKVRIAE